jgi:hypothetical protein
MRADEIEDAASSWTGQYSVDKKTTEEFVEPKLRYAEPDQDYHAFRFISSRLILIGETT